jgi:hypothetical protein
MIYTSKNGKKKFNAKNQVGLHRKVIKSECKITTCPQCKNPTDLYIDGIRSNFCGLCGKSLKDKKLKIEVIEKTESIINLN